MELIAAVVLAGPLGYLIGSHSRSLGAYLLVWAVILPLQTIAVHDGGTAIDWEYAVVNAAILAFGIGMNGVGARLRSVRRAAHAASGR